MATKNKLITAANFRDFDWNKAKLFYHIAKCGSFIKAAQLADTDQPSLTRQMQTLEKQVGCPLLIRKPGNGVILTRKGEELLAQVAPFFLGMRGFCGNPYVENMEGKKRRVRIVTSHAVGAYIISDLTMDYTKKHPDIFFDLIANDSLMDIITDDADISIQPLDNRLIGKKMGGLQYDYLFSLQKKLYASAEYIKTHGEPKTVNDLINHHIISFSKSEMAPSYINWILTLGMPEGELNNPVYTSNSIDILINAAEKGIGIIASYEKFLAIKNCKLINILPDIKDKPLKEYFVYPNYLKEDRTIMDIKNYLMEKLN